MEGRITVVGAGVVGLSCAVRLAESGAEVNVLARDLPLETTSAAAGALWLAAVAGRPGDTGRWARETLTEMRRLAGAEPETEGAGAGVRVRPGTLLFRAEAARHPAWDDDLADVIRPDAVTRPAPGFGSGVRLTVPLVDMSRYLPYLTSRLRAAGGTLTRLALPALPSRGIVVNCAGVAARALAADQEVRAVRSQVAVLSNPGIDEWYWYDAEPDELLCVLPHDRYVVVGCTQDDGDWSVLPDGTDARRLVGQARRLVPALEGAEVLGHRVGLKPFRPAVRLDAEPRPTAEDPDHVRIHCYGHGGSGVTLAWGCAGDVVRTVHELTAQPTLPI